MKDSAWFINDQPEDIFGLVIFPVTKFLIVIEAEEFFNSGVGILTVIFPFSKFKLIFSIQFLDLEYWLFKIKLSSFFLKKK